jgi:hypothetical protein
MQPENTKSVKPVEPESIQALKLVVAEEASAFGSSLSPEDLSELRSKLLRDGEPEIERR